MDSFAYFEHVLAVFSIKMRPFCDYVNLQKQFVIFRACLPSVEADKRVKRDPGSVCQNQDLRVRVQPADADGNRAVDAAGFPGVGLKIGDARLRLLRKPGREAHKRACVSRPASRTASPKPLSAANGANCAARSHRRIGAWRAETGRSISSSSCSLSILHPPPCGSSLPHGRRMRQEIFEYLF